MASKPTDHQVRKGIQRMAGLSDLFGYEQKGINQLSPGVRKAKLEKIDLTKLKENGWYVTLDNGKTVQTSVSSDYGVEYLPAGKIQGNFLYLTSEVSVNLQQNDDLKTSKIISTEQKVREDDPLPGSTRIVRGDSQIIIHEDYIEIKTPKLIINGVIQE